MITPSLAMIPQAYKSGKVYSQLPVSGDGDFDFTRASSATRVNKDGFIEEVAVNVPRLDYSDGDCPSLLLEPARTNLITYSENLNGTGWSVYSASSGTCTRTLNYGISPSGKQDSTRVVFSEVNTALYMSTNITGDASGTMYVKGVSGEVIGFGWGASVGSGSNFIFNGEWQRLEFNGTSANSALTINTFDPERIARDFEIYGVQMEAGSFATSYIPTNGVSVTRVAEAANGAGNASTFNDSEGVLFAEISALANGVGLMTIGINDGDGTADNFVNILYRNNASEVWAQVSGSGSNTNIFLYDVQQDYNNKIAISYSSNSLKIYINGILKGSANLIALPVGLNSFNFRSATNLENFYGNVKKIQYYNTALTDAELQALTA